jgi:hypothetical protein
LEFGIWNLGFGLGVLSFGFWSASWRMSLGFWVLSLGFWVLDFGSPADGIRMLQLIEDETKIEHTHPWTKKISNAL